MAEGCPLDLSPGHLPAAVPEYRVEGPLKDRPFVPVWQETVSIDPALGTQSPGGVSRMWRKVWQKNVGPLDRGIRLSVGALLTAVGLLLLGGLEASVVGMVVAAFGLWFMFTGSIWRCPLYVLLGITTLRDAHAAGAQPPSSGSPLEANVLSSSPDRPEGQDQPQRHLVGTRR